MGIKDTLISYSQILLFTRFRLGQRIQRVFAARKRTPHLLGDSLAAQSCRATKGYTYTSNDQQSRVKGALNSTFHRTLVGHEVSLPITYGGRIVDQNIRLAVLGNLFIVDDTVLATQLRMQSGLYVV